MRAVMIGAILVAVLATRIAEAASPLVVLDPGHGGEESGTRSASGTEEKALALAMAARVRAYLTRAGLRVKLTRSDDRTLSLGYRPELAHRLGADVFVSIHLNHASDPERRGWETYVLSAEASDALTRQLLSREEGAAPAPAGPASGTDLDLILGDLHRTAAQADSARLAHLIQTEAGKDPSLGPSRGLRQAPFTVLAGARIPAVLVEAGYLSNEVQAKYFEGRRGQRAVARAIAAGILRFLGRGGAADGLPR